MCVSVCVWGGMCVCVYVCVYVVLCYIAVHMYVHKVIWQRNLTQGSGTEYGEAHYKLHGNLPKIQSFTTSTDSVG